MFEVMIAEHLYDYWYVVVIICVIIALVYRYFAKKR